MTGDNMWLVSLLGARMHFAVPRILHEAGLLEHLFTDFSSAEGWPRLFNVLPRSFQPAAVRRLLSRHAGDLPCQRVTAFNSFGFEYARRRRSARTMSELTAAFLWSGREFCQHVNQAPWGNASAVFTFNSAGLETLELARSRGLRSVMEQTIAPKVVEMRLLCQERERWPGWGTDAEDGFAEEYAQREQAEWTVAELILCGSEFVRDGIRSLAGPAEKCVVVPYGVDLAEAKGQSAADRSRVSRNLLRVLTVGGIGLRKGSPYVLEAAKRLKGAAEFRMVGPVSVLPAAEKDLRANIEVTGSVPRSEVACHYAWADVFLLPSICEGSATVTYEAMAHGLPVVCTPNTGSMVSDGVHGFIVPACDSNAVAEQLERLIASPGLLANLSENARRHSRSFTMHAYGKRLLAAVSGAVPDIGITS